MKVLSYEKAGDFYAKVTFGRDGDEVTKHVRLGDCARACLRPSEYRSHYAMELMKAAREADRDFAFKKHGADFRQHCEYQDNFWKFLSEEEFHKLFEAASSTN